MSLYEKVKVYFLQNNILNIPGAVHIGAEADQPEQILSWDTNVLGAQPTQAQLDAAWETKLAQDAAVAYQGQRASEYPSFADQFDLLYHGGYDAWKAAIQTIKAKYPKPE